MRLEKIKHIHFVGIKGVGMSALAVIASEMGKKVTGSDLAQEYITQYALDKKKIKIWNKFAPENIYLILKKNNLKVEDLLIVTTGAHKGYDNPEVKRARKIGIKIMSHGEALGLLMQRKRTRISVAGTHGKTTTAAMVAYLFTCAKQDPSYAVGTGLIGKNMLAGHWGRGDIFVAEADEYITEPTYDSTPRFLWQNPNILVITNIEYDHPDAFANIDIYREAFSDFANKIPKNGAIIACIDSPQLEKALDGVDSRLLTYGYSPRAEYRLVNYKFYDGKVRFVVRHKSADICKVNLVGVAGRHNALNATAASLAATEAGMTWSSATQFISYFPGAQRRFESKGNIGKTLLFDDYAHHPSEIQATLKSARELFPNRNIIVVFQPHMHSRTKALFSDFARSFGKADKVILTDIFPSAREKKDPKISSKKLSEAVKKYHSSVIYRPKLSDVVEYLSPNLGRKQAIITMGAGDVYKIHKSLLEAGAISN